MTLEREDALRELFLLEDELARRSFLPFVCRTSASYAPNWHHERLAWELDEVLAGRNKRLIVNMPPQHGKSEQVSRRFPAYALGRRPDIPIIHASYNADLATEMSRDVQAVMDSKVYRRLFPGTRLAGTRDAEIRMAAQFDVVGTDGSYRAAGVGQGITGKSMLLGIIDDPIKSRAEAESEAFRRQVWNWYVSDFRTRSMGDDAAIVLVQTRWHEDDLAGRLLRMAKDNPLADQWRVVSFPAVCEELRVDDPRQLGEALWPSRFSREWLEATRVGSGVYDWSALYQQRPVPPGGAMGQRAWFKVVDVASPAVRRCRCWDLAGTKPTPGRDPDWTVGVRLAMNPSGIWTIEHIVRTRTTAREVDSLMKMWAQTDGPDVLIREWQDPGAAGKAVIEAHRLMLAGRDYEPLPSSGEKSLRWRPFLVQAEAGNVQVRKAEWTEAFLDEISLVPYALHDDQADAVAGAFIALSQFKDYGPSLAVVMPSDRSGQPSSGDWRRQYFSKVGEWPQVEDDQPPPRRSISFGVIK